MIAFNLAAYAHMGIANPVSEAAIRAALDQTDLKPGDRAAELGCGNAAAAMVLARHGLQVLAVDRGEDMVGLARRKVAEARLDDRITVRRGEAAEIAGAEAPFRLVAALGTTALADFGQLASWIAPGGWLLWGDLLFHGEPVRAFMEAGLTYDTDAGWRARGRAAGLKLVDARISDDADWDAYLADMETGAEAWIRANPDHPGRPAVMQRAAGLAALYGPASRATLGFGLYLFRKP